MDTPTFHLIHYHSVVPHAKKLFPSVAMGAESNGDLHLPVQNSKPHEHQESATHLPPSKLWKSSQVLLRLASVLLSIAGLVLMAKDKQMVVQYIAGTPIVVYARHSYVVAFVYLVYANGLAAVYCFILALGFLLFPTVITNSGKATAWIVFLLDQSVTYVLLAAAAASTEVSYIAKRGDDKVTWSAVCNMFERFCNIVGASLVATFLSVVVLAILSVMSAQHLFKHYSRC